ncbi:type II toxin-antitoxin system RelE/ParE family toxin [Roseateles saccharophilus]|uniref:Plasmid stabilization system protein ParE n=1 Tax=Roseateles saccharophilus TaxID=304 RepID=A0A4R3U5D5_ROSSA|nr:type II toxin-antitoxin system RelE/ParE family toxin [Roseateles saccharophilus]TCU80218.1 plasmid stabilization system protein ParE [Roseateles saccharophilus]
MSRLIWSQTALLDVQRLFRFLAPKNLNAVKRAVKAIRQGVNVLGQQPGAGRPIEGMPDEFREWIIDFGDSGYVARYRIDSDTVTILAARHQKEVDQFGMLSAINVERRPPSQRNGIRDRVEYAVGVEQIARDAADFFGSAAGRAFHGCGWSLGFGLAPGVMTVAV